MESEQRATTTFHYINWEKDKAKRLRCNKDLGVQMRSKDEQKKKRQVGVNQVRGNRNLKRSKGNAREKKTGGRINEGNTNQFQWEEGGDERQKSHDANKGIIFLTFQFP